MPCLIKMLIRTSAVMLSLAVWMGCSGAAEPAKNANRWPEFRGPNGNGKVEASGLPVKWSEKENVVWKTPVTGKAWSSPVVWDKQVWVTNATPDGKALSAVCLDFDTGEVVYDIKLWDINEPQYCIDRNSYGSPTPVIEEGRVYCHFGAPGTACIDTATGKVIWDRTDFECNHHRGAASSPIVYGDLLILTFDGYDHQYLAALNKATGKTVWRTDRNIQYKSSDGDVKKAYSTPLVIEVGGQDVLISPSAGASVAYDPKTGKEIWRVQAGGMNASARPLYSNGLLFMTTAAGGFGMYAVKPDGKGDVTASHVAWKSTKGVPTQPSFLEIDGLIYTGTEKGVITALDETTGEPVWQERVGGDLTPSPAAGDGKIYFFSVEGEGTVLKPGRTFEKLATNKLDGEMMASPAIVGKSLVVRTKTHVYRIEDKAQGTRE